MSERVTVDRKEFEAFLSDNQALLERSQKLVERTDAVQKMDKQLRDELKTTKEKLDSLDHRTRSSSMRILVLDLILIVVVSGCVVMAVYSYLHYPSYTESIYTVGNYQVGKNIKPIVDDLIERMSKEGVKL